MNYLPLLIIIAVIAAFLGIWLYFAIRGAAGVQQRLDEEKGFTDDFDGIDLSKFPPGTDNE